MPPTRPNNFFRYLLVALLASALTAAAIWGWQNILASDTSFLSPLVGKPENAKPLNQFTILNLATKPAQPSQLTLTKELSRTKTAIAYQFAFTTQGKKMTGQLTIPLKYEKTPPASNPMIVMLRGYVPPETYETGVGTRNAAAALAAEDFITVAPDFFGYGDSDPEPADSWQARFEKPSLVVDLIASLETNGIPTQLDVPTTTVLPTQIGLWAHSNGGQIALTTLEILAKPIPTTLWAPVTAPFPYSILFFSDESDDEGKAMRLWLSQFEKDYNVFDFSLTKHLNRLTGPIQLHHGTADEAALTVWSDEFADKVAAENERRTQLTATDSAAIELPEIQLEYHTYPGADHNLQPSWQTVVDRDIDFFKKHLIVKQ